MRLIPALIILNFVNDAYPGSIVTLTKKLIVNGVYSGTPVVNIVILLVELFLSHDMSGLEALGVASSILQVISFAAETISLCKAIYDGRDSIDDALDEKAALMFKLASTTERDASVLTSKGSDETDLAAVATKCKVISEKIKVEAARIGSNTAKGSIARASMAAIKSFWRKPKLYKLERELDGYREIMASQILVRLLERSDSIERVQEEAKEAAVASFQEVQRLTNDLANGTQSLSKTLKQAQGINPVFDASVFQWMLEKQVLVKQSMTYPAMNARWNQVKDPHSNTYEWVLHPDSGSNFDECKMLEEPLLNEDPWPSFTQWLRADTQKWYWISGKPGSGKSTLIKFLASHEMTLQHLGKWRRSVKILKHFFWKPGGGMQSSIKGLWCSLTSDLLGPDDGLNALPFQTVMDAKDKWEHHDWAEVEIKNLCLTLLAESQHAHCIFIDGLDEVNDTDGARSLLQELSNMKAALGEKIKLCVSSRLENPFLTQIRQSFELKLHLLTKTDMEKYVWETLNTTQLTGHSYSSLYTSEIANILLTKAQGVFIWLCLALKSIMQGFDNGDSEEEIMLRAQSLPTDIQALYQDMWGRLNDNEPIYRTSAATLFSFLVVWLRSVEQRENLSWNTFEDPTTLHIAFALNYAPATEVIIGSKKIKPDELERILESTARAVCLRSAGFLEVCRDPSISLIDFESTSSVVRFIHRTAYDYITGTEHGRSIAGIDVGPPASASLNVAKSVLAHSRVEKLPLNDSDLIRKEWLPFVEISMVDGDANVTQKACDFLYQVFSTLKDYSRPYTELDSREGPSSDLTWKDMLKDYPKVSAHVLERSQTYGAPCKSRPPRGICESKHRGHAVQERLMCTSQDVMFSGLGVTK